MAGTKKLTEEIAQEILNSELHGRKIYLLGSSEFGPTNRPVLIKSLGQLQKRFGLKGSLIDAFQSVKEASQENDVYVVKTTGTHAITYFNVNISDGGIMEDGFVLKASESNEAYNNVKITLHEEELTFHFPVEFGSQVRIYRFEEYELFGQLVSAINTDTENGLNLIHAQCLVDPSTPLLGSLAPCNPEEVFLYGGDSGLSYKKNQYYHALQQSYDLLEGSDVDVIVPVEAYMDDVAPERYSYGQAEYGTLFYQDDRDYLTTKDGNPLLTYYGQLLDFCARQMRFGLITHGVMGFNPTYDPSLFGQEDEYIFRVVEASLALNFQDTTYEDLRFLVSVVAGDLGYRYGQSVSNGYTAYAGLIASLSVPSNTTNVPLPESILLFNEMEEGTLRRLADMGVVAFRHSPFFERVVVFSGVTPAESTKTDLHLLCNVRMVQLVISYVRKTLEGYIGEDITGVIENGVLRKDVEYILNILATKDVLLSFEVDFRVNWEEGELRFILVLQTQYMIEGVKVEGGFAIQTT